MDVVFLVVLFFFKVRNKIWFLVKKYIKYKKKKKKERKLQAYEVTPQSSDL